LLEVGNLYNPFEASKTCHHPPYLNMMPLAIEPIQVFRR